MSIKNILHIFFTAQGYYSVDYEKCKHCFLYSDLHFRHHVFPSRLFAPLVIESKAETVEEKKAAKNQTRYIFYVLFELIQVALRNDIRRILAIYFYLTADDKTVEWTRHVYGKRIMSGSRTERNVAGV